MSSLGDIISSTMAKIARSPEVKDWLDELAEAEKREKNFLKEGERVVKLYEADTTPMAESDGGNAYNILYANTETLSPALYNSIPRPVVQPRFRDADQMMTFSGKVMMRALTFLVDANQPGYSSFDDLIKGAVLEALVPGRGCTWFKYDPTITQVLGEGEGAQPTDRVDYETVCGEEVPWNRIRFGYAKTWKDVPWVAREHFWTREEAIENLGKGPGAEVALTAIPADSGDKTSKLPANAEGAKFAHVWEIWDKRSKKVQFISEGGAKPLKTVDDPLQLEGFFPMPKPLTLFPKVSSMVPKPIYTMYETQASELNSVTKRIGALTKALKVRGFYDSTLTGMDTLMAKGDNTLLAASNVAAMQQGQTLDKAIWLMPLDKIVMVLQQLYLNRQQVKQVIYEITGIADIMRGSSQASETLGAQQIKQAWGTLRLKRMQKEVGRYSVDCLRIMAELIANHFSPVTLAAMTGLKLPTAEEKGQAQAFLQQAQMTQQPQQSQPGMPQASQAPPPDPAQLSQAQAVMQLPTWGDVLKFLKNDFLRNYAIDIETNSTIDAEATEDKQDLSEFMNSMGQLMNSMVPLVEQGFMPFTVAKGLMLAVVQKFRFGREVEDEIKGMQQPQPKPDPAQAKAEADLKMAQETHQMDMQSLQGKQKMEQDKAAADAAQRQQDAQAQMAVEQEKLNLVRQANAVERERLQMEMDFNREKHAQDLEMLQAKTDAALKVAAAKPVAAAGAH